MLSFQTTMRLFVLPSIFLIVHSAQSRTADKVIVTLDSECLDRLSQYPSASRQLRTLNRRNTAALRVTARVPNDASLHRHLLETEAPNRQLARQQIAAGIHLAVLDRLAPNDIDQVLDLELRGRVEEALDILLTRNPRALRDTHMAHRHMAAKYGKPVPNLEYPDENVPTPVATDTTILRHLDMLLVENPFLPSEDMIKIINQAPCLAEEPELNFLRPLGPVRKARELSPELLEIKDALWSGYYPGQFVPIETDDEVTTLQAAYRMQVPNDPLIVLQWWLFGPGQGVPYGVGAIDAWAYTALRLREAQNTSPDITWQEFEQLNIGMPVAIVDSGCSRSPDLVAKYTGRQGCASGEFDCVGYVSEARADAQRRHIHKLIYCQANKVYCRILGPILETLWWAVTVTVLRLVERQQPRRTMELVLPRLVLLAPLYVLKWPMRRAI
eukprot:Blabericola_migrator_1__3518@NODE_2043_length_3376_cov_4_169840_g1297_i0_p1_GENE_NODE_2043_length_3376_cov_4_169840_g1297_i0NODE_2043_length_3376_cov_4_169840_g1297_i0_p1_ORF_typecomplete_len442_score59_98_NODE_2043_length_3376_cov_4_169840_g1297_i04311756